MTKRVRTRKLTALLADGVEPAIAEHGGRVVKNTGDGFLAEFPSAVEAVRAALHFQTSVRELTIGERKIGASLFRVGINIGDVIVEAARYLRRRRQYCGAARGHRRTRRHLHLVFCLRSSSRQGRGRVHRSGRAEPQEHCPSGACLRRGPGWTWSGDTGRERDAEPTFSAASCPSWSCRSRISAAIPSRTISSMA